MHISARIEISCINTLKSIADKTFQGNTSKAIEWILYSFDPESFYHFMAKKSCADMHNYRELLEAIRDEKRARMGITKK